ncbi:PQQ-dependent sugar dehydrogenase [Halorubrum sp. 48-1-W]|uniref:PQQ-dependent sugar dehydrogenase n=1 Tax=Halorubrum sp. 48-1-W TaxID=2249761 RepID=UPI000DCB29D5|nr:PQQ-dependent sugar dehydrogenase [Halorubrum sp. 48-1-W]RAW46065.1 PQQ-dependent sugar dehydrogenase [Halorubrum sp. 48-1-W]
MDRRRFLSLAGLAGTGTLAGCTAPEGRPDDPTGDGVDDGDTSSDAYAVETVASGFEHPWALAFLPDGDLLVTERAGTLDLVDRGSGDLRVVEGTPAVDARGQGGLLDVALHPEYPDRRWTYLTYSAANADGDTATHLGRGRLDPESARLEGFEVLHVAEPFVDSTGHYGSRVVFGDDGRLYVTVGDRQFKDFGPDHVAQDLGVELGKTLRLTADGSVPDDNPFVDDPDARDPIFSFGHRNAQGLTVHPETGALWESEYGERDGDEINVIREGENYGWPVADEGCTYDSGEPIGVSHDDREDVTAPAYSWPCGSGGFPPGGMTFCTGTAFPDWEGDLFVGGLAVRALGRLTVEGSTVTGEERLLADRGWRVRTVAEAPDTGHLYVAVDAGDAPVVRLMPA